MATIRKLRDKLQGQVRRKGSPPRARSFDAKVEAERWARGLEAEHDRCGSLPDNRPAEQMTLRAITTDTWLDLTPGHDSRVI